MPYWPRHRRARPNLLAYILRPNEGEGNTTMTEPIPEREGYQNGGLLPTLPDGVYPSDGDYLPSPWEPGPCDDDEHDDEREPDGTERRTDDTGRGDDDA